MKNLIENHIIFNKNDINNLSQHILEDIVGEVKRRRKKNCPSAQKQVGGKVNAGLMDAVTCCGMFEEKHRINESIDENYDYHSDIESILKFMRSEGLKVFPYPSVKLDWSEQDGLFIKTGYYLPDEKKVVVFCKDRHPKDILRSFSHEMIHHMQNLEGKDLKFCAGDDVKDNEKLEKIESEAYLKGNIYFRKWTEYNNSSKKLNEGREPDFYLGVEKGGMISPNYHVIDEEVTSKDIDLSSFTIKKELNPKFWKDGKLDSRIRMKLLDIADDFIDFLGVDWVKPKDIIMTGSLASFTWDKKHSDIDLHILMDFSKVDKRKDFVSNYFNAQKKLWNEEHSDIKILHFPVEVYVQDINEPHKSSGIYSLEKDTWVLEPELSDFKGIKIDYSTIKEKVANYAEAIEKLEEKLKYKDDYHLDKLNTEAQKLFSKIKGIRKKGLKTKKGEFSNDNITFKALRRLGYIERLVEIIRKTYNKLNSLT